MIKADTNELRNKIEKLALLQYHKLYNHGKHGPDTFDCAGFVWYVYNILFGIDLYQDGYGLSTTTKILTSSYGKITYFEESNPNKNINLIKKGDIIFFHTQSKKDNIPTKNNKYPGHCGIYLSDYKFIHCTRMNNENKVVINDFYNNHFYNILVASKDIVSNYMVLKK